MPSPFAHFHLTIKGGDIAYWLFLRALSEAGFEVTLDFQPSLEPEGRDRDPDDRPLRQMVIKPRPLSAEIEASPSMPDTLAGPIATGMGVNPPDISGLNIAIFKRVLREWLMDAIRRHDYTIAEAERLFAALNLE
ncbi:MAG: hypothetical protein HY007_00045 [Candidatus Sungbacteria bacterium]|nr:hypothetical protein [Candidatus Sungbacteria bacterium]